MSLILYDDAMKAHLPRGKAKYFSGTAVRTDMSTVRMIGMHLERCIGMFGRDGGPHG